MFFLSSTESNRTDHEQYSLVTYLSNDSNSENIQNAIKLEQMISCLKNIKKIQPSVWK